MKILYLVIPCYNEEEVLPETSKRLLQKVLSLEAQGRILKKSRILFVDDGSRDNTWPIICGLHRQDAHFAGIKLARNQGHQNALLAGLMAAKDRCDICISMDADLQDDIEAVDKMLDENDKGSEVVYGVRSSRKTDTFFKRFTAQSFYKFMKLMGVDIVYNHADYRLLSKKALEGLAEYKEVNLFLRGIVPLIGYKSSSVTYERQERFAGKSKYSLKKMLSFAFDGMTSFSIKPIRWVTALGALIFLASVAAAICTVILKILGRPIGGLAAVMLSVWAIAGILLLSLGIIGEYIGKIYSESKARPRYRVEAVELTPDTEPGAEQGAEPGAQAGR